MEDPTPSDPATGPTAHLATPAARIRLAVLAARLRGEAPRTPSRTEGLAYAMRSMSELFERLAQHTAYVAEEAEAAAADELEARGRETG